MKNLTGKQIVIIIGVLATALLHLGAAFDKVLFPLASERPDITFTLNAIGYLGLLGAYFLPIPFFQQRHKLVWWALFVYIIITIIAWLFIWVGLNVIAQGVPFFSQDSLYGVPAKIIEVILLILLWQEKP
ncbi:MAG: hypothetical protein M1282_11675 [Chloroflexi bacterium]|nr:hypothetical protein [Chloroflexota bacterium]